MAFVKSASRCKWRPVPARIATKSEAKSRSYPYVSFNAKNAPNSGIYRSRKWKSREPVQSALPERSLVRSLAQMYLIRRWSCAFLRLWWRFLFVSCKYGILATPVHTSRQWSRQRLLFLARRWLMKIAMITICFCALTVPSHRKYKERINLSLLYLGTNQSTYCMKNSVTDSPYHYQA